MTATELLKQLDATELRHRLDEIDAERKALIVLLRAAKANERRSGKRQEVPHA